MVCGLDEVDVNRTEQASGHSAFWDDYWMSGELLEQENELAQVGRTVNRVPVDRAQWQRQVEAIADMLELQPEDEVLDLCAGNGLIARPISKKCRSVTAVDISEALLSRIDAFKYPNIEVVVEDLRSVKLPSGRFSKGLMYGALQYFSDAEVLGLFDKIRDSLREKGLFLVGDILDLDRLLDFYNTPERVRAYLDSLRDRSPGIGFWFKREILVEMGRYAGFSKVQALNQQSAMTNSHYRFDLLLVR